METAMEVTKIAEILKYTRPSKVALDGVYYRKLTVSECEKLQTLPVGYCSHVSPSQAYKQIGNGWTIDVIVHILKNMK